MRGVAVPPRAKINKAQIKLLRVAQRQVGLSDEEFQSLLHSMGVESTKDLTWEAFDVILGELKGMGFVYKASSGRKKYDELGERRGMASAEIVRMLEAMWADIYNGPEEHMFIDLRKFILREYGKEDLTWLTASDAHKCVEALKSLKRQRISDAFPESEAS